MEVRAIMDTGSQQSYVTERVKDTIELTAHDQQMILVLAFGTSSSKVQVRRVVKIQVDPDESEQELELFTVPFICQPLISQPIDLCRTRHQHLSKLDLADPSGSETA